jgi:regulator of PEP synthase PpsR (kinase-PPPase family)
MAEPAVELHIVSDSTGETAARLVLALEAQFPEQAFEEVRHTRAETVADLERAVLSARGHAAVVIYTLVDPELRDAMRRLCRRARVHYCDLLGHPIDAVARVSGQAARMTPGSRAPLTPAYFRRIEAMEFAVKYDDGVGAGLDEADIVLVGVSRTSKTPLSIYLGYLGHKVANVPIVKGIKPPKELFELDPTKIVGLTIHADRLAEIRRARVRNLGANNRRYAELTEVYDELDEAAAVQKRLGCPVIDISELSIEETAQRILRTVEGRRSSETETAGARVALGSVVGLPRRRPRRLLRAADADLVGAQRTGVAGGVPRPAPALTQQAGFEHSFAGGLDAIRGGAFARSNNLTKLGADVAKSDVVVGRNAGWQSFRHQTCEDGTAPLLAVVVRACAPRQEAEALHRRKLGTERIGDAVLEPADHSGAPAGQQHALLPGLPQDLVETVRSPDREGVGRVPTGDEDHVMVERQLPQSRGRPGEEVQVRHLAATAQPLVPPNRPVGALHPGGRHVEHPPSRREVEHVLEQCLVWGSAHRNDCRLRHNAEYCRGFVRGFPLAPALRLRLRRAFERRP